MRGGPRAKPGDSGQLFRGFPELLCRGLILGGFADDGFGHGAAHFEAVSGAVISGGLGFRSGGGVAADGPAVGVAAPLEFQRDAAKTEYIAEETSSPAVTALSLAKAISLASVCGSRGTVMVLAPAPDMSMRRFWSAREFRFTRLALRQRRRRLPGRL